MTEPEIDSPVLNSQGLDSQCHKPSLGRYNDQLQYDVYKSMIVISQKGTIGLMNKTIGLKKKAIL